MRDTPIQIPRALMPRFRGRGAELLARLEAVAVRLEAGMRETPQRFIPVTAYVRGLDTSDQRRFLAFLAEQALRETQAFPCPPRILDLLVRAHRYLSVGNVDDAQRDALADAIEAAAPRRRRRRHIHCHGAIADDRRQLLLRSLIPTRGAEAHTFWTLQCAIAYAMSDYDYDHFVMQGAHVAKRIRELARWLEGQRVQPSVSAG